MKKRYMIISLIIVIVVSGLSNAKDNNLNARELGENMKILFTEQSKNEDEILGYVNNIEISANKFEIYKETSLFINKDITEKELLKKYTQHLLIVNKAEEEGFTVSNKEIEQYTNEMFDALENDDENMKIIIEYIDGMGITMAEYKEMSKQDSYKTLLVMKLHDKLKSEFLQNNKSTMNNNVETNIDFNDYLKDYKEDIYNKAEKNMNNI